MPDDTGEVIQREIDRLPERHRSVVVLCDIQERSHEEAAGYLKCPVGTVKSRLTRARDRLRDAPPPPGNRAGGHWRLECLAVEPASRSGSNHDPKLVVVRHRFSQSGQWCLAIGLHNCGRSAESDDTRQMVPSDAGNSGRHWSGWLAWLAHERQAIASRPQIGAPAADQATRVRPVDLTGNWIVRGYPSGQAFGLIKL